MKTAFFITALFVILGMGRAMAQVPPILNYQGRVGVSGVNFEGSGQFKFALVNSTGTTTYWSNDGSSNGGSQPSTFVTLPVSKGLYSVLLGDASLPNMTTIPASVFSNAEIHLRVWFSDGTNGFQVLAPDRRLASVAYSMMATTVPDGAITGAKVAPGAISEEKMLNAAVGTDKIANLAVTSDKLALASVTTDKLSAGAITADKLGLGSVIADKLATNAVTTDKIMNGSVTAEKLAPGAINNAQLSSSSLTITAGAGLAGGGLVSLGGNVTLSNAGVVSLAEGGGITVSAGMGAVTLGSTATSANTAGAIVARDATGGFSATLLNLSTTVSSTSGLLTQNGSPFLHSYGTQNFFAGLEAGNFLTTGSQITAVGFGALAVDESGSANTAVGYQAMRLNISGSDNTALGRRALNSNTSGSNNVAVGRDAGANLTTGSNNIHIGNAGVEGESGTIRIGVAGTHTNTYIAGVLHGDASGLTNLSAASITPESVGSSKIVNNTILNEDVSNTAGIVYSKLNLTGSIVNADIAAGAAIVDTKLAIISTAGKVANSATTATSIRAGNTIVLRDANGGFSAGSFTTDGSLSLPSTGSSAVGVLNQNGVRLLHSYGTSNFFAGSGAGNFSLTGTQNTGMGVDALTSNLTGSQNTALGNQALTANSSGQSNVALGALAASSNTSGSENIAIGASAAQANLTGGLNTSVGTFAAQNNTTGGSNVSLGHSAGRVMNGGSNNTALGTGALIANVTGSNNIAVGAGSGGGITKTNDNILIGNPGLVSDAGIIRIGTPGTHSTIHLAGVITGNGFGLTGIPLSGLASDSVDSSKVVDGSLVNADIAAAAAIADTKLGTIQTVGKVANTATTGTSSNAPSTLVLRDANGDFSAGAVTATTFSGMGSGLTGVPGALPWNVVAGTTQLALPNQGYVLTNAAEVSVTLPATPAVGDIVRLSGAGAGGWKILPNAAQSIITVNLSSPPGLLWSPQESARDWSAVASSGNGTKRVATVDGGQIYVSSDSGRNWTARDSNRAWGDVASSSDGTRLAAVVNAGRVYVSSDSGTTWTARENNRNWQSVAVSADGTRLVAVATAELIYLSSDSGASWTTAATARAWKAVASSADGNKLVAAVDGGFLFTSTDSGATWTQRGISASWQDVTSSADGSKLAAVAGGGRIYVSTDSGVTWTPQEASRNWSCVTSSATGDTLVAGVTGGQLYVSHDSGLTWTAREVNRLWTGVACSADGARLLSAAEAQSLFASELGEGPPSTTVTTGVLRGLRASAVELQYIGNDQFMPLSSIGTLIAY